ncbi:hypothetical protein QFC24_001545 [Naganishia onofrii]|uniref:Uncharacterized protein n=1 Tax=Naganishia onofrii TaxID=1851511 RepID=A0ACC2XR68_9TREE|nr:hypothetical protein QFC24_001545 [Naganishia onofrii]
MPIAKAQTQAVYPHTLSFAEGAIVSAEAILKGEIIVAEGVVIHPFCQILAHQGSVTIGANCNIEENVIIECHSPEGLVIGSENVFECGAWVEAQSIGDANSFQAKCHVASDIKISEHCSIGLNTTLSSRDPEKRVELIPPYTIVYGRDSIRRTSQADGMVQERAYKLKHLEYLRDLLPK